MRPSVVFSVSLSAHIHGPVKISSCMFSTSSPPIPSSPSPVFTLSPSEKSRVLSGTNSRDKKGLNESRTTGIRDSIRRFLLSLRFSFARILSRRVGLVFLAAGCRRDVVVFKRLDRADGESVVFFFFFSPRYGDTISRISGSRIPPGIPLLPD